MSYTLLNHFDTIAPLRAKYDIGANEYLMLRAVADRENDDLWVEIFAGRIPDRLRAWSNAGIEKLAHLQGVKLLTAKRALASLESKGIILVTRTKGTRQCDYRRINTVWLRKMLGEIEAFNTAFDADRYGVTEDVDFDAPLPGDLGVDVEMVDAPSESASEPAQANLVAPATKDVPCAFAAKPTEDMSPAVHLATAYYNHLKRPSEFRDAGHLERCVREFESLLTTYSFEELSGTLHWAFEVDSFWPTLLMGASSPLQYLMSQLPSLMRKYNGFRKAADNKAKSKQAATGGNHSVKPHFSTNNRTAGNNDVIAENIRRNAERRSAEGASA